MRLWLSMIPLFTAVLARSVTAETAFFAVSGEPPPGFTNLNSPQRSLVDIYYGNRYLLAQWVTYTQDTVELSDPESILEKLTDLRNPSLVLSRLQGTLNSHSGNSCAQAVNQPDCGTLKPESLGVIFDESQFRLDIFLNPSLLATRPAAVRKYLPESDGGFALMQNFSAAFSGYDTRESQDDYNLEGTSILSWKESNLYIQSDYSRLHQFSVSHLYGQRNFEGLEYKAGLITSQGLFSSFSHNQLMTGVSISTSFQTRTDDQFSRGTPISVFIPVRGRVEIRKDGRLISSTFSEAGSQQLDTSQFPDGAYDIEIRVVDDLGQEQFRETRFFAKRYQLPPAGEWLFFAESGQIMTRQTGSVLPENTSKWMGRAGASRRILDTLSGSATLASGADETFMELGLFNLHTHYDLSGTLLMSTEEAWGVAMNGQVRFGDLSIHADYRKLSRQQPLVYTEQSLLGNSFEQQHLSASYPFFTGNLSYRYSLSNKHEQSKTRTHSLEYRSRLFRIMDYDVDISLDLSQSDDKLIALLSANFRYRQDSWNLSVTPTAEWQDTDQGRTSQERLRLSGTWDDKEQIPGDMQVNGSTEVAGSELRSGASVQYANRFGSGKLGINHRTGSDSSTSWGGNLSTSFLTDGNIVAMGGQRRAESAVVINTQGRDGDVFNVEVDGRQRGYAVANKPSVVTLAPFQQYRLGLNPASETLYNIEERERLVTLYPGNVVTLNYKPTPQTLLFGRLMYEGAPMTNARILAGAHTDFTDEDGLFQIEARVDSPYIQVEQNGLLCQVPLPEQADNVVQLGTLNLEPVCFKP